MDTSGLTNEQLMQKMQKISTKLSTAKKLNLGHDIIKQMNLVLFTYQDELQTRLTSIGVAVDREDPCVWDMDSYLEQNNDRITEQENLPRWKSAAINEAGTEGGQPWDSDDPFGFN